MASGIGVLKPEFREAVRRLRGEIAPVEFDARKHGEFEGAGGRSFNLLP